MRQVVVRPLGDLVGASPASLGSADTDVLEQF